MSEKTKAAIRPLRLTGDGKPKSYRLRQLTGHRGYGMAVHPEFLSRNSLGVGSRLFTYIDNDGIMYVVPESMKDDFERKSDLN